jgi:hypothetical protein
MTPIEGDRVLGHDEVDVAVAVVVLAVLANFVCTWVDVLVAVVAVIAVVYDQLIAVAVCVLRFEQVAAVPVIVGVPPATDQVVPVAVLVDTVVQDLIRAGVDPRGAVVAIVPLSD